MENNVAPSESHKKISIKSWTAFGGVSFSKHVQRWSVEFVGLPFFIAVAKSRVNLWVYARGRANAACDQNVPKRRGAQKQHKCVHRRLYLIV